MPTAARCCSRPWARRCISASAILVKLADTGAGHHGVLPLLPRAAGARARWPWLEQRRRGPRQLAARGGAFVAGLFLAVDLVLWNHAIAEVGAGIATVLGNLQVLFVALAAWVLLRERPERRFLIALPVVMGGVVLVSGLIGSSHGRDPPARRDRVRARHVGRLRGVPAHLAPDVGRARRTSPARSPRPRPAPRSARCCSAWRSAACSCTFRGRPFGWLLLLSLTSQTIGWLLITSSLPRLPAAISSLTLLLQPAAAMLLAAIVLGERPSLIQVAGAVVVCAGVLTVSLAAPSPRRRPPLPAASPGPGSASAGACGPGCSGEPSALSQAVARATGDSRPGSGPAGRWRRRARPPRPGTPAAGGRWSAG